MKIDKECIDHNVALLTKELTESLYDMAGDEHAATWALMTLANIRGVIELAEELKKVVDA